MTDNPILCDSALPEILSVMEINHTKITGVANCPTLSEQPVTTKRNNFLGYIGPDATTPLPANLPQEINEMTNINPLYNVAYNPLMPDISNQVKKSAIESTSPTNHDENHQQNQIQSDQPKLQDDIFMPLQHQEDSSSHIPNLQPLPYQHPIYKATINDEDSSKTISEDTTRPNRAQISPERQISKLTSEIEELRAKLQELASENQRLTHDLNQHNNLQVFAGNTRPILPLEQIASLSTIKPPNGDFVQGAP